MTMNGNQDMTIEAVTARMRELQCDGDCEQSHRDADELLAAFLRSLGYVELADLFDTMKKWYA